MAETVKTKWYEETPGATSSKRIAGAALLALGVVLKVGLFFAAIFAERIADGTLANSITDSFFVVGGALLGVTVLEGVGSKIGGGN